MRWDFGMANIKKKTIHHNSVHGNNLYMYALKYSPHLSIETVLDGAKRSSQINKGRKKWRGSGQKKSNKIYVD